MIYQIENDKNSADIIEKGLIIALDEGNISAGDMVLGSDNKYVVSVPQPKKENQYKSWKIQIQQITML